MGQVAYWRKLSRMTALRRKLGNQALCDRCGMVPAQERHHLIPKSSTNAAAREVADEDVLTCLLCRACHDNAHAHGVRERIFRNLYAINGRGDVVAGYAITLDAFTRLKALTRLTWDLPEPGENGEEE